MDRLAQILREDATAIDAAISDALDRRIQASLVRANPEPASRPRRSIRAPSLWWASSLTGLAAAIAVIAVINQESEAPPTEVVPMLATPHLVVPQIDFEVEAATLTDPLSQELENLRKDLRMVEETVWNDVRFDF